MGRRLKQKLLAGDFLIKQVLIKIFKSPQFQMKNYGGQTQSR